MILLKQQEFMKQKVKAVTDEAASSPWPLTTQFLEQVLLLFDLLTLKEKR